MTEAISAIMQERSISEELVLKTIETTLMAAYKKKYGENENAVIRWDDANREVSIYAKKTIVNEVNEPWREILLDEAKEYDENAELGDELLIEVNPKDDFSRGAVASANQTARQSIREIKKNSLYSEFKDKKNEIIIGYYQRERNGTIYVDLGKIEGIFPKKFQSPKETYHVNDRIKALIFEVKPTKTGIDVILSRTHPDFVRAIFELEVPEIYDKVVEIHKLVREPGYRTKISVYSNNPDVDPVGACVGKNGQRIQNVIRELEGEKIDILKYDPDPCVFIKNALLPAEVQDVLIMNPDKHQAMAIVKESQLSLAIGKQGMNVKLANRLSDWSIDVKTESQFEEMGLSTTARRNAEGLFNTPDNENGYSRVSELPGVDREAATILRQHGLDYIEDFLNAEDAKLHSLVGISDTDLSKIRALIEQYYVIVEQEETGEGGGEAPEADAGSQKEDVAPVEEAPEQEFVCPKCGAKVTPDMAKCPKCGVGLSFDFE
jgi:N utilization substance protein A